MPQIRRTIGATVGALFLCTGCGGGGPSTAPVVSGVSARLINASSGSQAISLVATAHGVTTTIGPETGGKTSAYTSVPSSAVSAGNVQTTFTAYAGSAVVATLVTQIAPGSKETIVYQAGVSGGNPVLVPVPDKPVTGPAGGWAVNAINVSANFGQPMDVWWQPAYPPPFDVGPTLSSVGLGQVSRTQTYVASETAVLKPTTIAVTVSRGDSFIIGPPWPTNALTASGNFSIYLVDTDSGGSQILLVDDTGS